MYMSPVARSNDHRHGLRTPMMKISGSPPPFANGLSAGMPYFLFPVVVLTSMRRILPSSGSQEVAPSCEQRDGTVVHVEAVRSIAWPLRHGSPPSPPSPVPM